MLFLVQNLKECFKAKRGNPSLWDGRPRSDEPDLIQEEDQNENSEWKANQTKQTV